MSLKFASRKNIEQKLFFLLMISTFIGYIGYYFYSMHLGANIYFIYSNYFDTTFSNIGFIPILFRYLKDILVVILSFFLCLKMRKTQKNIFLAIGLFTFGGLVLGILNALEISTLISGIRCYVYFFVIVLFFTYSQERSINLKTIEWILLGGLIINALVQFEQMYRGTNGDISLAGTWNYRFPALFGGTNSLASFVLGVDLFYLVLDIYCKKTKTLKVISVFVLSIIIVIFTGTRSALINILFVILAWIVLKINIKEELKIKIAAISAIVALPVIIILATKMAARGDILEVQLESGRLFILKELLSNPSILGLIFGYGIGAGSNADVALNQNDYTEHTAILDGTFNTVIYQYGLIGLVLCIGLLIYICNKLTVSRNFILNCVFLGTVVLQAFTTNIFEAQAFLILLGIVFAILTTNKFYSEDLLQKKSTKSKKEKYKISVIMVCLNSEDVVRKTLESLANQTYKNYEFIVKDGLSKDKTLEIVSEYKNKIKNVKVVSKRDIGIYDAMNQAVKLSKGEYIYFLNAGDELYSAETLANVSKELDKDIVYGDMIYGGEALHQTKKLSNIHFLLERMLCHQSIFAKKELLLRHPFENRFKFCADRHWLYSCVNEYAKLKHIDEIIGCYDTTGVSSNYSNFDADSLKVIEEEFGVFAVLFVKFKRALGNRF